MADEASKTLGGGVRNGLGSAGFLLMMFGGYFIYEQNNLRAGLPLIGVGFFTFISPWAWSQIGSLLKRSKSTPKALEYLSNRDHDLSSAIVSAAWRSAYGRWFSAQALVNDGSPIQQRYLIHTMASQVMDKLLDGEIEVRGRMPGQMDYAAIPRTHWRSSAFYVVEDNISLWQVVLAPRGTTQVAPDGSIASNNHPPSAERNAQLRDYDSLIVDAYQFEEAFPRNDAIADKKRRQFLRQALKRNLDKDEILKLLGGRAKWQLQLLRFGLAGIVGL